MVSGPIVLCSWERHFTLTVALSTQVYKWVPGMYCWGGGGHPIQGGGQILLVASCYRNRDKLWPNGPLGSYANLTLPTETQQTVQNHNITSFCIRDSNVLSWYGGICCLAIIHNVLSVLSNCFLHYGNWKRYVY